MPSGRRCLDCPTIIPPDARKGLCLPCRRARSRARGTPTTRGYGSSVWPTPLGTMTYDQARAAYQRMLDDGATLHCACGCSRRINPNDWHLGHDDDRSMVVGPTTPSCNLGDAGRASAPARRT